MNPLCATGMVVDPTEMMEIPSLRELGDEVCGHWNESSLNDGARLCLHCRAIKDGAEWRGGSLDTRRFYMPHARGYYQPIEGGVRPTSKISVKEWQQAEKELANEQQRKGR
jgi:hypothetical protein